MMYNDNSQKTQFVLRTQLLHSVPVGFLSADTLICFSILKYWIKYDSEVSLVFNSQKNDYMYTKVSYTNNFKI